MSQVLTYSLPVFFALISLYAHARWRKRAVMACLIGVISGLSLFQVWLAMRGGWSGDFVHTIWLTVAASIAIFALILPVNKTVYDLSGLFLPLVTATAFFAMGWYIFAPAPSVAVAQDFNGTAWIFVHIGTAVATYAMLTIAACASLAVWIKEHALKRKMRNILADGLPPVMAAESLQMRMLSLAEGVLAVSLLSGMAVEYTSKGVLLSFSHKEVLSLLAFVVIGFLLLANHRFGVRGKRASRLLLLAYLLVVLGYPGVKLIIGLLVS
ncbi:cytochrome c assembly protein [Aestuariispira insulae]|uniref:Cytochrome c assembly protein n=2 Tax=Aestuariispira insulae TaxID=1461337 RepID=A0A3D9HUW3_9PROT|nr:cytochrome c assembly protein [Aestuariispira insulae]